MKKKMALLMAAIMALSPVSAFASTSNRMDGTITTSKKKTVLMERSWMNSKGSPNGRDILDLNDDYDSNDIEYVVQGSDLVISATTDQITAGDTFTITLNNAEWAFANEDSSKVAFGNVMGAAPDLGTQYSVYGAAAAYQGNVIAVYNAMAAYYQAAIAGATHTPVTPANIPTQIATWPSGDVPTHAEAIALWNAAEIEVAKMEAAANDGRSLPLTAALYEHSNTVGYEKGFVPVLENITNGSGSSTSSYKFASGALQYIASNTSGSTPGNYNRSTFNKALGAYTSYDAGAYLRYGSADAGAGALTPVWNPSSAAASAEEIAASFGKTLISTLPTMGTAAVAASVPVVTPAGGEIPYMMRFTGAADRRIATITVLRDSAAPNATTPSYLRIPMVVRLTGDGSATVNVATSNNGTITGVTYTIGTASGDGKTTTTVNEVVTSRNTFELKTIKISEDVINTMKDGWFYITAPYGYTFADPTDTNNDTKITMSSSGGLRYLQHSNGATWTEIKDAGSKGIISYAYEGDDTSKKEIKNKLWVRLSADEDANGNKIDNYSIERFNSIAGSLYLEGITLLAEDYAPFDKDVLLKITSSDKHDPEITEEEFKVAARKDWLIKLTASSPIPTLVNGRFAPSYDNGKLNSYQTDDFDGWHKTSKVTFEENVVASWWEERDTELTLPEGVKYIKVKIDNASGTDEFEFKRNYVLNGEYDAVELQGQRDGYVKVSGSKLTLTDLTLRASKKANFTIQPWVSIESGFEGDITMTAGGTGVPYEIAPVVIAKAVSPITIDTEVTDVKIGYQWQKVADFTLNETGAGRLLKDRTIVLSIDDSISKDEIAFAPDSVVEKSGNISFTKPSVVGGNIELTIDRESNGTAGAIKFSNVYVKIDRTVPESNNHPYKIVATGNAIAANYVGYYNANGSTSYKSYEPVFSTRGIGADYLNVVTAATDKPGVLSNTVRVSIGSDVVLVGRDNPVEIQMDTAAYISAESNSTMVPVRFVSVALGIPEGQIQWDEENRTVTINYTNTTVQMKAGSDQLTINGVTTTMYSPDVPPKKVTVEMKDNRSFLPFRQLGYALGVPVAWDDETRTAIYNAPEDLNTSSSVVADAE